VAWGEGEGVSKTKARKAPELPYITEALRTLAVPTDGLVCDPANARTHGPANLDAIAGSLKVYGQRRPLVANRRTGAVEAGNGTLEAARALGWSHVAVVWVDDDPATAAGFSIADNRTAELAGWDQAALDALLKEVPQGQDERLDAMLAELATAQGINPPDFQPVGPGEQGRLDEKARVKCPHCGEEFVP
jgi:hypothetical protein